MADVVVGEGILAGKGVYAARDFEQGELVVPYDLTELSQQEFDALPESEREWTHSFYGKIYLFSEPSRYVNHSDDPTTYPEEGKGDVALRPIKKGEPITINDKVELQRELDTFLDAYEEAANSRDFAKVEPFIGDEAVFWFTNDLYAGKAEIQKAFNDTWGDIQDETYTISNVQWVARNYWVSSCIYTFTSDGIVNSKRQVYTGKGTNVLARQRGSWRIVHEHLSK